ncbi:MAG TPA: zinc ribbon domain-containing protein [Ktedonobacteraceae bacterium]|nr:zinc ribbon domain-containing protein [Ktedonobacteraceae bacterium]
MSDFLESAKSFVNAAMSRTGWEAQKQIRVRNKQTEIDKLVEQRRQLMDELGQVAMTLYQQGKLTDAQLSRLCASVFELDHDLKNRETQLQEIKNEAYPVDQFGPNPTTNYAPPPFSSSASTPPPPPGGARPQPGPQAGPQGGPQTGPQAQQLCPQCGGIVRPNSLYCRNCGAKVR